MKVIVCLDKSSGMMFNNRRQSRDAVLIEDVINYCGDKKATICKETGQLQ